MATWCFGPYASLRGFGNGGPNPRYLLTLFLILNGVGAEHVIRWYLHRGFLVEDKDCRHVLSIFEALKTDQFHRQGKTYKHLLVCDHAQMSKPEPGEAWTVEPIPKTSDRLVVMHSIANATVMLKNRSKDIPNGIVDTLNEELRIEAQAEFNFFTAPTERSRLMGPAYEQTQVNVYSHLKVQTLHPKELPVRGISKVTTRHIPGKLIGGPYHASYYADLDAYKPNNGYHLHATALAEDVGSCAIEHGRAPKDTTVTYKPSCVNVSISDQSFPILNRGDWVKEIKQAHAPLPLLAEEQ